MAVLHINFRLHDPALPESPGPIAGDAATEPDVEILDSPAGADEFHDAIDQMDRQIDQLDRQIDQLPIRSNCSKKILAD